MRINKTYQYTEGNIIGSNRIVFISEVASQVKGSMRLRYAKFQCHCGNFFETKICAVKTNHTTSCGCIRRIRHLESITTHGMRHTSIYNTWDAIRQRISNENSAWFKNYGGRGIIMFPPWIHDFQLFLEYVSALPNYGVKGLTLDRINNNGNYEPGNLRWTTYHIQLTNTRMKKTNTSGYTGVSWFQNHWVSQIQIMYKNVKIGYFDTKEQAVTARNNYIIVNNLSEYKIQSMLSE